jgi:hypothetical protein
MYRKRLSISVPISLPDDPLTKVPDETDIVAYTQHELHTDPPSITIQDEIRIDQPTALGYILIPSIRLILCSLSVLSGAIQAERTRRSFGIIIHELNIALHLLILWSTRRLASMDDITGHFVCIKSAIAMSHIRARLLACCQLLTFWKVYYRRRGNDRPPISDT